MRAAFYVRGAEAPRYGVLLVAAGFGLRIT